MNDYERMLAYLIVAYHNLWTLHHHLVADPGWFGNHEKLGEWYELLADHYDDLTEIGLSQGFKEPTISEAVLLYQTAVLPTVERKLQPTMTEAAREINALIAEMQKAEKIVAPDIMNRLQEYEYAWRKIANYMIRHALGGGGEPIKPEEDD